MPSIMNVTKLSVCRYAKFKAFTAVLMKIPILCDATQCRLIDL
jgi:hypothetical protein